MSGREWFVIIAGRSKESDSEIVGVAESSPARAHQAAAEHYRRTRKLAANVHVETRTAHRCATEADAQAFVDRLMALLEATATSS